MTPHRLASWRSEGERLPTLEPEVMLIAAIIRQAIADAQDARLQQDERAEARAFLMGDGILLLLCDLLGIAPEVVTRRARSMLVRGDAPPRWRAA
jgi:hypothetical protein